MRALAAAAPPTAGCGYVAEVACAFGESVTTHAARLLLARDHLQNEVHSRWPLQGCE